MKNISLKILFKRYSEITFWIVALLLLASLNLSQNAHFTLCISGLIGIDPCPGCGLGRSISLLLQGKPEASIDMHPLGVFALPVILHRIYVLIRINFIPSLKIMKS